MIEEKKQITTWMRRASCQQANNMNNIWTWENIHGQHFKKVKHEAWMYSSACDELQWASVALV